MPEYNNINVGSYQDLQEGASTNRRSASNLKNNLEDGRIQFKNIQKERIFEGPLADYVSDVWNVINSVTENNISTLEQNANTLDRVGNNYYAADQKSNNDIGGIV